MGHVALYIYKNFTNMELMICAVIYHNQGRSELKKSFSISLFLSHTNRSLSVTIISLETIACMTLPTMFSSDEYTHCFFLLLYLCINYILLPMLQVDLFFSRVIVYFTFIFTTKLFSFPYYFHPIFFSSDAQVK